MTGFAFRPSSVLAASMLAAGVLSGVATPAARAQSTVFTDRTAFDAATTNRTTLDFEGLASAGGFSRYPNGLTLSGTTFTGSTALFVIGPNYFPTFYGLGSGAFLDFQQGSPNLTVALPAGVTAFGLDLGSSYGGSTFTFTLSTGERFPVVAPQAGPSNPFYTGAAFVGFTSSTPLTSLTITSSNNEGQIDNFTFGTAATAAAVPEPSEYAALGAAGLSLCGLMVRAKRKKTAETAATA